ncbi:hypothetical protein Tco_0454286 [Tanacetum coccineum]
MNMALVLMAKAFKLNYSTPTNNNQRISSNPRNKQIAQSGMNMGQDRHMQMVRGSGGNQESGWAVCSSESGYSEFCNQNGLIVVPGIANQNANHNENGNVVATRAEGNGNGNNDGLTEVHRYENCYDNEIFNMFTQEDQYTELLEPITEPHPVQQNTSNVIFDEPSVEHNGGTVEQHPATVEETRACFESLYNFGH